MQKVVTLNTSCDIACLTFKLSHNTTGSFQGHQSHVTQIAFSEPPTFIRKQYTFHQTNEFCISQGIAETFFRCDGQLHNHGCSSFYSEIA